MTNAKHTPGPWAVDENDHQWITADCDGLIVAEIPYGEGEETDRHHEINDANARLIAAAPELLEALRDMVRINQNKEGYFRGHSHAESGSVYEQARAAIAKAEGAA